MRLSAIIASAFAVFAFQCGGQVDEACPSSPSDSCVQDGKQCTFPTTLCGNATTETCTCKSGSYECAEPGVCVVEDCSMDTYPGSLCSKQGLQCQMMAQECSSNPTMCTCVGHSFQCDVPDCPPPPPPPSCPPPDQVEPATACSLPQGTACNGPDFTQCSCNSGAWVCAFEEDGGEPIDAGASD